MSDGPQQNPFRSLTEIHAAHASLMERLESRDGDGLPSGLLPDIEQLMVRVARFGRRLNLAAERADAQSILTFWSSILLGAKHPGTTAVLDAFDVSLAITELGTRSPYKGLKSFQSEDAESFFGRRDLIVEMTRLLRQSGALFVMGVSGSGKSSVIGAGLLPALASGASPGSTEWIQVRPFAPGVDPLASLSEALSAKPQTSDFLRANSSLSATLLKEPGKTHVIFVDQLEELFTLTLAPEEQKAFCESLLSLKQAGHYLIASMRSEFDSQLIQTALGPLLAESRIRVPAFQAAELRESIEGPAERYGVTVDPRVVDSIVSNVQNEPAGLPLLEFALLKLWEQRSNARITFESYQALGGSPQQILVRAADEAYSSFKLIEDQNRCRQLFLSLVKPGAGEVTSRPRTRRELDFIGPHDAVEHLLQQFSKAGLLKIAYVDGGGRDRVELSHESVARNWPALVSWVRDNLGRLRRRQLLEETADLWSRSSRRVTLFNGEQLAEAQGFPDLSKRETGFLEASRRAEERRTRMRYAVVSAFVLLILLLLVGSLWTLRHLSALQADIQAQTGVVSDAKAQLVEREQRLQLLEQGSADVTWYVNACAAAFHPSDIYVVLADASQKSLAREMIDRLQKFQRMCSMPAIRESSSINGTSPAETELRFFHPDDAKEAEILANQLSGIRVVRPPRTASQLGSISPRHFELWIGRLASPLR
jgi:hypothetical protein